jgi:hypothetical protein
MIVKSRIHYIIVTPKDGIICRNINSATQLVVFEIVTFKLSRGELIHFKGFWIARV